jgi:Pectate lyase superfamily protein
MIRFARILTVGLLCCMPVWATVRNVQTCGATGNGTTDDTAAINSCIGQLVAGDTLLFPAGTYKITSALTAIRANNVEVSGSSGAAMIKSYASGGTIFTVGGSVGTTGSQNLTVNANELSQTISANFGALGASAGSYILIEQGPTGASGQRGEVLLLTGSAGTSATVATMVHDTFSTTTANEVANVKQLNTPASGLNFHDIILDGDSHTAGNAINITNLVNSTFTNVTVQNFTGLGGCVFNGGGITACYTYGVAFNNITITGTGNGGGGGTFQSGFNSIYSGNLVFNGLSITSGNGGAVADGVFAFAHSEGANTYGANITIDATTNGVGRLT